MGKAKDILVQPISKREADIICKRLHYSGKVDPRSQLHLGIWYEGRCEGVMQFGPSIDKAKMIGMVRDTHWNGFIELNRMAFSNTLPRNSESRALGVAFRLLKKHYPMVRWVISFADGTQCGDGTIYRAAGFLLTQIKKNSSMYRMPDGEVVCQLLFTIGGSTALRRRYGMRADETFGMFRKRIGAECIPGFQLRYLKLLHPEDRDKVTCPVLPYSEIARFGAGMYLGQKRGGSIGSNAPDFQSGEGGASPTPPLPNVPPC